MEVLGVKGQYVGKSVSAALSGGCARGEIEFPTLIFLRLLLSQLGNKTDSLQDINNGCSTNDS